MSGNRAAGSPGTARSFSGQGHEIYEESAGSRNVVSNSQSLSALHNSFAASSRFGGGSSFAGNRSSIVGNRSFAGGATRAGAIEPLRSGFTGFGNNGFGRGGFGRGCWNCGFGFGRFGYGPFGWGFGLGGWGWGWGGFGFWDPFWFDPWWGWPAPAYGYYPYYAPDSNAYGYPDSGYSTPDDNYNTPTPPEEQYNQNDQGQYDQAPPSGNWVTPNGPNPSAVPNFSSFAVPVLIYLRSGSVLTVRDYWMIDGELHYILMNGTQRTTSLEQVDLPRTNTENAKSGVKFIFKSEPSVPPTEPDGSAPPAKPNSIQPNGITPPEART